jgi:pantetheine-phosphate adenylyltransferase
MSYALVGGTFDILHKGHMELMAKAFGIGGRVLVCITSDTMAGRKPDAGRIASYAKRKGAVVSMLERKGWLDRAEIVMIDDPYSEGLRPGLTHIVVSPGTRHAAERINSMRKARHLEELMIIETGWVMADDGSPISDARIRGREIDADGRML